MSMENYIGNLFISVVLGASVLPNAQATEVVTSERIVLLVESRKQWCDENAPGFKEKSRPNYQYWKNQNKAAIAKVLQHGGFLEAIEQEKMSLTREHKANAGGAMGPNHENLRLATLCGDEWLDVMGGPVHPEDSFSSPVKTLHVFARAVEQGDHELAISCLTSESAGHYIANIFMEQAHPKKLIDGKTLREMIFEKDGVPVKEVQIDEKTVELREIGKEYQVTRFKLISGNWKIAF